MIVIGLDTATSTGGVGITIDGRLTALHVLGVEEGHSENLVPMVKSLLKSLRLRAEDVDGIAVTVGPGSFTGLRIGMAVAKALAYAWQVPLRGVSTLYTYAWTLRDTDMYVCASIDARRDHFFCAFYDAPTHWRENRENEQRLPAEAIAEHVASVLKTGRDVALVGEGAPLLAQRLGIVGEKGERASMTLEEEDETSGRIVVMPYGGVTGAANVSLIGYEELKAGRYDDLFHLVPHYLRRSEAERRCKQNKSSLTR